MLHPERQCPLNFCLVPCCSAVGGQPWARDPRDAGQPQFRGAGGEKGPGPPPFGGTAMTSGHREQNPNFTRLSGGPWWKGPSPLTHACMHATGAPHTFRHALTRMFLCTCSRVVMPLTHPDTLIHTYAVHTHSHPYLLTHTHPLTLANAHSHSPMLTTHLHTHTHTRNTHSTKQGRGIGV